MATVRAKRCFCTAPLLGDGTYPHACDPKLRAPGNRALNLQHKLIIRERASRSPGSLLSVVEAEAGLVKALPVRERYRGRDDHALRMENRRWKHGS